MSEMIERVARALEEVALHQSGLQYDCIPTWAPYRPAARTVILAMRKPTEAMVEAGRNTLLDHNENADALPFAWDRMIEEALK